ncbi:MAG: radical SAM protein [Bacteroidetes bacterium]|nr:radical SAM protein [bacterium]NBP63893.1 radical SAM protein [Bacteroidota bacterium]
MVEPLYASHLELSGMHLELTTRCNAACPMCPRYINSGDSVNPSLPMTEITLEQFKSWFSPEFLSQMRRIYACGNYGDPIAAKDTLDIYKYIRSCNDKVGLVLHTNGSGRSKSWWEELAKVINGGPNGHRDDYVIFSVDGLGDTNHLYRRNTNFDKIYENMKAFTAAGGKARWDYIVFEHNEHQVEEARKIADELGFTFFNVKKTTRWSSYKDGLGYYDVYKDGEKTHTLRQPKNPKYQHENSTEFKRAQQLIPQFVTNDEFARLMPGKGATSDIRVFDPDSSDYISVKHNSLGIICRARKSKYQSLNEIFVDGDGNVYPCCFLGGERWRANSETWNPNDASVKMIELNGGNESISLKKHTIEEIIASPLYQRYLPLSFQRDHQMRSYQCSACCGEEYNNLDQGELGTSSRSILKQKEREQEKNSNG